MSRDVESWAEQGLQFDIDDVGIAWLRLNRPQKRNATDRGLRNAIVEAARDVDEDSSVKVAVITANGPVFSSGADLTQGRWTETPPERLKPGEAGGRHDGLQHGWWRMANAIWQSETPFIAAVNGMAVGGGCQLVLACDIIIASEGASFWEVFVRRGLPLEGGGAWLLTRSLSLPRAKELALFGKPLSASEAERWGLINRCVPDDEFATTVLAWATELATLSPPTSGPSAGGGVDPSVRLGQIKGQINSAWEKNMHQTFVDEVTLLALGAANPQEPG